MVMALTETKKSPEGKTVASKDSLSHAEAPRYVPSLPKISDAKIKNISENLNLLGDNIPERVLVRMKFHISLRSHWGLMVIPANQITLKSMWLELSLLQYASLIIVLILKILEVPIIMSVS